MDSALKIYNATVENEGTALKFDKRTCFNRIKREAQHALKSDVCRSAAVGLYQISVVTSSSWSRNICTSVGRILAVLPGPRQLRSGPAIWGTLLLNVRSNALVPSLVVKCGA
jgi:hypothetical protein